MSQFAIALITHIPNIKWFDFLNKFKKYDIYIIIDDNSINYSIYKEAYPNIEFIQIANEECTKNGFINTSTITLKKPVTGWDKGLFYFSCKNKKYEHIWFIEDDVFVYNEQTLLDIDTKFIPFDIICNSNFNMANLNEWLWKYIHIQFPPPYYCGMMCACRISKKLLQSIHSYAIQYKTLFFLEALLPCIVKNKNLTYYNAEEVKTITHRNQWNNAEFNKTHLFHPAKNIEEHEKIRDNL